MSKIPKLSDNKVVLMLSCAFNPPTLTGYGTKRVIGEDRISQYEEGFKTFFKDLDLFNSMDIVITDNTIDNIDQIDKRIIENIPLKSFYLLTRDNTLGRFNNGVGLIHTWLYSESLISNYAWFIHHEPRQKTRNMDFIKSFINHPRNLFTINKEHGKHFNTGLFCIESPTLIDYCKSSNLEEMIKNSISIEDHLFDYFNTKHISYDLRNEMGLTWYPFNSEPVEW